MMLEEIILKNKNELNKIMEALSYCNFDDLDYETFESVLIYDFMNNYTQPIEYASGASKGVLIFKNLGFVIKIPFAYCDGCELNGAEESEYGWDYCDQEIMRYEMALNAGVQNVFLEIKFFDYINGYPIYIQPYADIIAALTDVEYKTLHSSSEEKDIEFVKHIDNIENYSYLNSQWEADLYILYGIEFYKKFKLFLEKNCIYDLTSDNIGYIGKNPILIDYARI